MRIHLIKQKVLESLRTEEHLLENSTVDALYDIRILKALLYYGENPFTVEDVEEGKQPYISEFGIYVPVEAYKVLEV